MAAHAARTLLITGAGAGLVAVVALARRVSVGTPHHLSMPDRLPAPERDPIRESRSVSGDRQAPTDVVVRFPAGPTARPLIPAQRRRT